MTRYSRFLTTVTNSSSSSSFDQTAAEPPEAVAVESDFVVILAALLCALICVLGLIAVARCAWLRRSSTTTARRNPTLPTANKGVKKKIVETLPKFIYNVSGEKKISGDCAICLSEYVDGDEIRVLPQCGHGFHVGCIDLWLSSHSSCPSCRQVLLVTRCKKCGEFPAVSAGADVKSPAPAETAEKNRAHGGNSCSSDYLP